MALETNWKSNIHYLNYMNLLWRKMKLQYPKYMFQITQELIILLILLDYTENTQINMFIDSKIKGIYKVIRPHINALYRTLSWLFI